jgi:exoribonuclease R
VPTPQLAIAVDGAEVRQGLERIRSELGIEVDHAPPVVAEAEASVRAASWRGDGRPDRTDLDLVTIDPPGSRDLDQAFGAERRVGGGYRVWYAIADVASLVAPGSLVDAACQVRGVTQYGPDVRAPLHPAVIGTDGGSLLPDVDRPALLWCIDLDSDGGVVAPRLERAIVRSRAQRTYQDVLDDLAGGAPPEHAVLLREIGLLRQAAEVARGGVSLPIPEQVIEAVGDSYRLAYDAALDSEGWNAQISLLTGMEAAGIMLAGGSGLLRTLPPPESRLFERLRRSARALGVAWPEGGYPAFVRSLEPATPAGSALLVQSSRALRGAGYVGFRDGALPDHTEHSAVAAPYAHVTAPLRRLCDRATNEVVLAHVEGRAVPAWALEAIDRLPEVMADARSREGAYTRSCLDLLEALVLRGSVGRTFDAVVVDVDRDDRVQVQLTDPAVLARARAEGASCAPGDQVTVRLREADPVARRIDLAVV